jgi:hypothetical protein
LRRLWINLHLYTAAFLAPMLILVATSGGLYLIGVKGTVEKTPVATTAEQNIDPTSETLEADVRQFLAGLDPDFNFEYLKQSGDTLVTRPTSRTNYEINTSPLKVSRVEPDLQKHMIELHKGHGPLMFKTFQKVLAVGLLFIVLSGLWLGLSSTGLLVPTLAASGLGLVVFVLLAMVA